MWRTLIDALTFAAVLIVVTVALDRLQVFDLGSGNASALDGDSLRFRDAEVRLHGIDAPEYRQSCRSGLGVTYPCGRQAADALRQLVRRRMISCTSIDTDRYGRAVSVCRDGELELNREMVRLGWAVAYLRHSPSYVRAQAEAKSARRGIWAGEFEMPEDYRYRMRAAEGNLSDAGRELGD